VADFIHWLYICCLLLAIFYVSLGVCRITAYSVQHNNLFILYQLNNMFWPNEAAGWQEWQNKYKV